MKRALGLIFMILLAAAIGFSFFTSNAQNKPLGVGDRVPPFVLKDQFGEDFDISQHLGKYPMVIYFYPKDDTPGCTKEACSFRDSYEEFTDRSIRVIGISSDSVESHREFAEKYQLPFTLLADTENQVRDQFGVKSDLMGLLPGRVTYVVDDTGRILFVYDNQFKAQNHIREALEALQSAGY